jgi:hypothetical protein
MLASFSLDRVLNDMEHRPNSKLGQMWGEADVRGHTIYRGWLLDISRTASRIATNPALAYWNACTPWPRRHSRAKKRPEDLGQPLRRQSDRSPAVLLHQYLELALEHLEPSVYQIRLGAHCDTPAISDNRG